MLQQLCFHPHACMHTNRIDCRSNAPQHVNAHFHNIVKNVENVEVTCPSHFGSKRPLGSANYNCREFSQLPHAIMLRITDTSAQKTARQPTQNMHMQLDCVPNSKSLGCLDTLFYRNFVGTLFGVFKPQVFCRCLACEFACARRD